MKEWEQEWDVEQIPTLMEKESDDWCMFMILFQGAVKLLWAAVVESVEIMVNGLSEAQMLLHTEE